MTTLNQNEFVDIHGVLSKDLIELVKKHSTKAPASEIVMMILIMLLRFLYANTGKEMFMDRIIKTGEMVVKIEEGHDEG